jgi:adenosine kinase
MPALICGSLAFDTITTFPGRFAEQILPEQVHILNVSFLVPTLRREWGGCAGNIAYNLQAIGGAPVILAAVGVDGGEYVARVAGWGADTTLIHRDTELHTAQCHITTDRDNNQITAFHPGAMSHAHQMRAPLAGIPFIFDPGQQLPQFVGEEHRRILGMARWVAMNDYEARMLEERTGETISQISQRPNIRGVVVTLAAEGCELWIAGQRTHIPGVPAAEVLDPTGCGDAFRAALLYGLERGWELRRCVELGNRIGAIKIAERGPQNHSLDAVKHLL